MGDAIGARIAARDYGDAQFVSPGQAGGVPVEDSPQIRSSFAVPFHAIRMVELSLYRREGWYPGNVAVPHATELIVPNEEAMFDGVDAALNRPLNAHIARGVRQVCFPSDFAAATIARISSVVICGSVVTAPLLKSMMPVGISLIRSAPARTRASTHWLAEAKSSMGSAMKLPFRPR